MYILDNDQVKLISGGCYSAACFDAFKAVTENRSYLEDLFILIFLTPLGYIGKLMGEHSALKSICGSEQSYQEAKAQYCLNNPSAIVCREPKERHR